MMKLIWTRSDILSDEHDAITWAFDHRSSHFAIGFFDEAVFLHSHFDGVGVDDYYDFYKTRIKVYEIEYDIDYTDQAHILQTMIDLHGMLKYDYKFFWWLFKTGFKKKILGIQPPLSVGCENPDAIICHEILSLLPDEYRPKIDFNKAVMPEDLYSMVKLSEAMPDGL